jgi:predicted DCC family thiol-disulfide oxidoreductase YuxK
MKPQKTVHKIIVFYDGKCGLCHRLVRFILTHAKNPFEFCFAPVEGKLFVKTLEKPYPENTVVVVFNKKTYTYLAAVGFILKHFRSFFYRGIGTIFLKVPKGFGRLFYLMMTSFRQYIFKKPEGVCPVIDNKFKKLFFL